ncbi:MAG: nuclear transport factor 2 family protein [Myxococcota bacterium]
MTTICPRSPAPNAAPSTEPARPTASAKPTATPAAAMPAWQAAMHPQDVLETRAVAASPATPSGKDVAVRFYDAFVNRRVDDMEALYAPDVKFKDAIFEYQDRAGTMHMWRKILSGSESKFEYKFSHMDGDVAVGHWVADYKLFGRPIHNEIESRLTVKDGKIVKHEDNFPMGKWARQALPIGGLADVGLVQWGIRHVLRGVINN